MTTIDNNVVFYMRGDTIKDIALNITSTITNVGAILNATEGALEFNGSSAYIDVTGLDFTTFLASDYTVEFEAKHRALHNQWDTPLAIINNNDDLGNRVLYVHFLGDSSISLTSVNNTVIGSVANGQLDKWYHFAFVKSGNTLYGYVDGQLIGSTTAINNVGNKLVLGSLLGTNAGTLFDGYIKNVMLTKGAKYNENFTPKFEPHTSISINNVQINNKILSYDINKSINEDIIKIEVLSNNNVIYTTTTDFADPVCDLSSITDNASLLEIRVYYTNTLYVSKLKNYINITISKLSNTANMLDMLNKLSELNNYQALLNNKLCMLLQNQNVEVANDMTLNELIEAVDEGFSNMSAGSSDKDAEIESLRAQLVSLNSQITDLNNQLAGKVTPAGTAVAGDVLSGKTFINSTGQTITGTITNRGGAQTVTPGTSNKTLYSGYYSGNITVSGDTNLKAANIKSGTSIFGVTGSYAGSGASPNVYTINTDWYPSKGYTTKTLSVSMGSTTPSFIVLVGYIQYEDYEFGIQNNVAFKIVGANGSNFNSIENPYYCMYDETHSQKMIEFDLVISSYTSSKIYLTTDNYADFYMIDGGWADIMVYFQKVIYM